MTPKNRKEVDLDFLEDREVILKLFGPNDKNLVYIEKKYSVNIYAMGRRLEIEGKKEDREKAAELVGYIGRILKKKTNISFKEIKYIQSINF